MFTIESPTLSLQEKRSLLDWVIAPKIRTISGVADLNALGGKVKTYEVVPDLELMRSQGITLNKLMQALEQNNLNDGAGRMTQGVESILVRRITSYNVCYTKLLRILICISSLWLMVTWRIKRSDLG